MKVTIKYRCDDCDVSFSAYCGVPDQIQNNTVDHKCPGLSEFAGVDGIYASYMCNKCGHITRATITAMIPAMASRLHGCGAECGPE